MNLKRWARWSGRIGVLTTGVLMVSTTLAATGGQRSAHSVEGPGSYGLVSESTRADGSIEDTWRGSDGSIVTVSGASGLHVKVEQGPAVKGLGQRVDHSAGVTISGGGLSKAARTKGAQAVRTDGLRLANSVYATPCASWTNPSGHVYIRGCDTQYLDIDYGGGDWYMADKSEASGRSNCASDWTCDRMTQLYDKMSYLSGNTIIQWTPNSTTTVGNCNTVSLSMTSNQSGIGYSSSQTICPNSYGPYTVTGTDFGGVWNGKETANNQWEGVDALDEDHSPAGAPAGVSFMVDVSWCNWC